MLTYLAPVLTLERGWLNAEVITGRRRVPNPKSRIPHTGNSIRQLGGGGRVMLPCTKGNAKPPFYISAYGAMEAQETFNLLVAGSTPVMPTVVHELLV